jgi:hypothetical protein
VSGRQHLLDDRDVDHQYGLAAILREVSETTPQTFDSHVMDRHAIDFSDVVSIRYLPRYRMSEIRG